MGIFQKLILNLMTRKVIEWWLDRQAESRDTKLTNRNAKDIAKLLKDCEVK